MKLLGKAELIVALNSKIKESEVSSKDKAKKLRKLLEKLTKSNDINYIWK